MKTTKHTPGKANQVQPKNGTFHLRWIRTFIFCLFLNPFFSMNLSAQEKPVLAVLPFDARDLGFTGRDLASLARMETEKLKLVSMMDPYEIEEIFKEKGFDPNACFSKNCLNKAGTLLSADRVMSGTIEKFGNKILITLRLLDVSSGEFISSDLTEYINMPEEIQRMMRISVHKLFNLTPDQVLLDQLSNVEDPIISDHSLLKLNGPRFGVTYTAGDNGARMQASKDQGGFDMFPATFMIGYQQEFRYQSTDNFQALIEVIGSVGGLESGYLIPSLTFLNGFRWGKSGWEIGFGPTLRLVKSSEGFYDTDGIMGKKGAWHRKHEWNNYPVINGTQVYTPNPYQVINRIDSRGTVKSSVGLLFAAGRTFRSGYLNVPVNVFYSPRKDGSMMGISCGFNINRR